MDGRAIIYRSEAGQEIRLVVPWGTHSGRIPPPTITFYIDQTEVQFVYQGTAD